MTTLLHPSLFWWGLPLGALLFVMSLRSLSPLSAPRAVAALVARALVLLLLLAALAGPERAILEPEPYAVVYVVDMSASVADATRETVLAQIGVISGRVAGPTARQALVVFGGRADVLATAVGRAPFPGPEARRALRAESEARALQAEAARVLEGHPTPEERARAEGQVREAQALQDRLARLQPSRTDLDDALTLAVNLFPDVGDRRILLYTDANINAGRFGRGSASDQPGGGRPGPGVRIALFPVGEEAARDAVAEDLDLPAEVRVGEAFDARVSVSARSPLKARVSLLLDDAPLAEQNVEFPARGRQAVVFPNLQLTDGFHRFRVAVDAQGETERRNNQLLGAVLATGRERVLVVDGLPSAGANVEAALAAQDVVVERRSARTLPATAADLAPWGAVVLAEVAHDTLARDQWQALERYVADSGGGLLLVSGTDARALAAFKGAPEEALLPVAFEPPKPEDRPTPPNPEPKPEPQKKPDQPRKDPQRAEIDVPSAALLLVIDKSGSMAGKKMTLAKEAAIAAAEALKEEDQIGVLAFDEKARWVLEFTSARKRNLIADRVARILPGGGTEIFPALEEAQRALLKTDAQIRHVILLTDGYTNPGNFQDLVLEMARQKITTSSIGIGDEFDGELLSAIAKWGHGRYYFTSNFDEIPQLFVREARRAIRNVTRKPDVPVSEHAKPEETPPAAVDPGGAGGQAPGGGTGTPAQPPQVPAAGPGPDGGPGNAGPRGPFSVVPREAADILKGITAPHLPLLDTYARAQARKQAVVALAAQGEEQPVLAFWRYELGKVAVWTSDLRGDASGQWVAWPSFSKFLGQLVRSVGRSSEERALHPHAEVRYEGGEAVLTVQAPEERESEKAVVATTARWAAPDAEPAPLAVEKVGVGQYRMRVPVPKTGTLYTVDLFQRAPGGLERATTLGLARPYEEEYHDLGPDPQRVEACARRLGATLAPALDEVATVRPRQRREAQSLAWIPLLLALLLLPVDVAVRRLGI